VWTFLDHWGLINHQARRAQGASAGAAGGAAHAGADTSFLLRLKQPTQVGACLQPQALRAAIAVRALSKHTQAACVHARCMFEGRGVGGERCTLLPLQLQHA